MKFYLMLESSDNDLVRHLEIMLLINIFDDKFCYVITSYKKIK